MYTLIPTYTHMPICIYIYIYITIYIYIYTHIRTYTYDIVHDVLLRGVDTLRYVCFRQAHLCSGSLTVLTIRANKWFLGAGFLGAPPYYYYWYYNYYDYHYNL